MSSITRLGLAAAGAVLLGLTVVGPASAQSGASTPNAFLPSSEGWSIDPNPNWSNIILGPATAGFKGKADWHFKSAGPSIAYYGPAIGSKITTDLNGFIFGVQAGYQHQFGPILIGAFTTLQGGDIQEVVNCADGASGNPGKCRAELNKVYTVQGRLGIAQGPWLLYINGGYAHADINAGFEMLGSTPFSGQYGTNQKIGHDGWVAGLGLAFKLRNGVTLGFEYNHIRVEANDREFRLSCGLGPSGICGNNVRFKPDPDVAGLRLNVPLGEQQTAAQAPVAQAQVPPPAPAPQAAPQPAVQRPAARPPAQPAVQRPAAQPAPRAPAAAPKAPPAPAKKVDPPVVGPDGKKGEGK